MSERIKSLSITSENGFVLIPTDNDSIKRLDAVLNVKGNSEMLSNITSNFSVPENIHAMAVKIDQKADDLIKTINAYFTMSKITSGDFSIKLQKENISRIYQDIILDYYDMLERQI